MKKPEQQKPRPSDTPADLSARCLRELTDELPRLLACRDRNELSTISGQILSRYIDMSNSTLAGLEPAGGKAYMIHSDPEVGAQVMRHLPALFAFQEENAYFQGKLDKSLKQLCQTSDWIDDKTLKNTALFNEFLGPIGAERQLVLLIESRPDGTRVSFGIQREGSDFTLQERAVFEFLRPFILAAYERIVALERTTAALGGLTDAMFRGAPGLIEMNAAMHILRTNETAERLLQQLGWRKPQKWRLPPVLLSQTLAAQARTLDQGYSGSWQVTIGHEVVSAEMTWNPQKGTFLLLLEGALPRPAADFKSLGLTPRQSEILSWIAQGKSNGDIATILGLSASTVARHVEQIFIRLGVETRTAAAAQAWAMGMAKSE